MYPNCPTSFLPYTVKYKYRHYCIIIILRWALHVDYKINKKPCSVNTLEGTCMFVYECINSYGRHIGMCVDTFMFGSCCAHNLTTAQLAMLPDSSEPAVLFTQPGGNEVSQRPQRPQHRPYRPTQVMMRPNNVMDADSAAASVATSSVDKKYHYHPAPSSATQQTPPAPHVNRIPSTNFISNSRPNFLSRPAAQPFITTTTTTTTSQPAVQYVDDNDNKVDSVWSHRFVCQAKYRSKLGKKIIIIII